MKPSIPKGTRDFSSSEVAKRNYIFNIIRHSFENFGFQPIETPSFEKSSTLMGKYGEEGDRLIFRVLDSADFYDRKIVAGNLEESLSLYISITYIFRDVVRAIIESIKAKNVDFLTAEEFQSYSNDSDLKLFVNNKIIEFVRLNSEIGDDERLIIQVLGEERDKIINEALNFIRSKGIDFKQKINDSNYLSWQLKWADRRQVKKLSQELYDKVVKNNSRFNSVDFEHFSSNKLASKISEKALRYDLTVPFARYVVQHQNDITFPFKRYQIQPVWRADRPQKGRFREFYQCDADVVGSKSLVQEVEFIQLYDTVFSKLGLVGTTIKINNRKILSGIAEVIGASDKLIDFTVALDKLDKIGKEGVVKEMLEKGISEEAIEKVDPLFNFSGTNQDKLASLEEMLKDSEEGIQGVNDLRTVVNMIEELGLTSATLELDVTLARGLNYYTGAIYEVAAPKGVKMGSIGGGGRYDDLTGIFGLKDVSGVGISFGLDRIYLVMEELNLFETVELPKPKVLFINFDESQSLSKIKAIKELRNNNIKSELYPDVAGSIKQQKKQWKYATNREIDFVVTDIENGTLVVKNMKAGEQFNCTVNELINKLQ